MVFPPALNTAMKLTGAENEEHKEIVQPTCIYFVKALLIEPVYIPAIPDEASEKRADYFSRHICKNNKERGPLFLSSYGNSL